MPFYEFECPKGHVTEKLCNIGTGKVPCEQCPPRVLWRGSTAPVYATRILSPTPTTFVSAGGRKL